MSEGAKVEHRFDQNAALFYCLAKLLSGLIELQRQVITEIFEAVRSLKLPTANLGSSRKRCALNQNLPSQKQDSTKPGFFDLPTELRPRIYEEFIDSLHIEARESGRFVGLTYEQWRRSVNAED